MTSSLLFQLALVCIALVALQRANGRSAVAIGPRGLHAIVSNPSYSQEVAKQKALALWYSNWHGQARILASTGVVGECALAFWRQGNRRAIGVALGKRSESEADGPAMKYCLQHCPLGARRNYKVADDETREIFQ